MMTAITTGTYVRHKTHTHRGTGKVLKVHPTHLRTQVPKLEVGFERGGPLCCWPDDLVVVPDPMAPPTRPALKVVDHAQVVA